MYELTALRGHLREYLGLLIGGNEPTDRSMGKLVGTNSVTYSANVFSTRRQNFTSLLALLTSSSVYVTWAERASGFMPSASASLAFLFAKAHSLVHLSCWELSRPPGFRVLRPHGTCWRIRPHGQVRVIGVRQGSASEHAAGAWQSNVQAWWEGRLFKTLVGDR